MFLTDIVLLTAIHFFILLYITNVWPRKRLRFINTSHLFSFHLSFFLFFFWMFLSQAENDWRVYKGGNEKNKKVNKKIEEEEEEGDKIWERKFSNVKNDTQLSNKHFNNAVSFLLLHSSQWFECSFSCNISHNLYCICKMAS